MSESTSGASLMDAKQFVYLPRWVKAVILLAAAALLVMAAFSVYQALTSHAHGEAIVFFLSVAQSAALVLIFFLLVIFSRRDANVERLHSLTDEFLGQYIARALQKVSIPALSLPDFQVADEGAKDIFGRLLKMTRANYSFQLWVGLNVHRIFVIYFVPLSDSVGIDELREIFRFTFGGAEKVGYHCNYEEALVQGLRCASIWLTVDAEEDLLTNPQDKLFWAQDIAMMTESFLRTAHRAGLGLDLKGVSPGPL